MVVNNSRGTFQVGGATETTNANTAVVDFTGLVSFTANLGTTGIFRVGDVASGTVASTSVVNLAPTSTINAGSIRIGDSAGPASVETLTLGTGVNSLNADTINVGSAGSGIRSSGLVNFVPTDTTGSVIIRGSDGIAPATLKMVSTSGSTAGNMDSTIDLTGHTADILASTVNMANRSANTGNATATLTFDQGTLSATTVNMATRTGADTGTINLGDSTAPGTPTTTIGTLMAVNTSSAGGPVIADMNVTGGNVNLGAVNMTNAAKGRTATATLDLTGGATGGGSVTITAGATLGGTGSISPLADKNITVNGLLSPGDPDATVVQA